MPAPPTVTDVRIGMPTGPNSALYLTAEGQGEPDRLIGGSTAAAAAVLVHETVMNEDGTIGMRHVEGLDLPGNGSLTLEPGGPHLMLRDVERLEVGDVVVVTLTWEVAGEKTVEAEVVATADLITGAGG